MRTRTSLFGLVAPSLVTIMVAGIATMAAARSESPPPAAPVVEPIGTFTVGDTVGYPSGADHTISVPLGSTVQTIVAILPPGWDAGWHHHPGAAVTTVTSGTFTLYDGDCESQAFNEGEGFVEEAGTVHRARNEGTEDLVVAVTFLGVPVDTGTGVAETTEPCQIDS
jgi:quercetin dioxygenase-like cupin family protein